MHVLKDLNAAYLQYIPGFNIKNLQNKLMFRSCVVVWFLDVMLKQQSC